MNEAKQDSYRANPKTFNLFLIGFALAMLIVIAITIYVKLGSTRSAAQIPTIPDASTEVHEEESEYYREQLREENRERVERAQRTGESVMPPIISGGGDEGGLSDEDRLSLNGRDGQGDGDGSGDGEGSRDGEGSGDKGEDGLNDHPEGYDPNDANWEAREQARLAAEAAAAAAAAAARQQASGPSDAELWGAPDPSTRFPGPEELPDYYANRRDMMAADMGVMIESYRGLLSGTLYEWGPPEVTPVAAGATIPGGGRAGPNPAAGNLTPSAAAGVRAGGGIPGAPGINSNDDGDIPLLPAGRILLAVTELEANSDYPNVVVARIVGGRLNGSKLLGGLTRQYDRMAITFSVLVLPNGEDLPVQAIAIDPKTSNAALGHEVDYHTISRLAATFTQSILMGAGETAKQVANAYEQQGTGDNVVITRVVEASGKMVVLNSAGALAESAGNLFDRAANRAVTVRVPAQTELGVIFTQPVVKKAGG